ncbi:glycosyltransferase family 4 protein [Didymella exigua CBS 183.55]|uniref:Glycosyltransferase family 4 protein n=1 Tax=Didymella exigua CBS 183.55 TaxID=1150837 RepID=A0A6A5RZ97_9PLEO|nr:glycosyltransferase family 4 protein [Didymella exigua CBS 183.55]KAF1933785.1 glycosyltransferase family 4 protein [Didymella exigua CBS 183.55]
MPGTVHHHADTSLFRHPAMVRQTTRDAFMAKTSVKARLLAEDRTTSTRLEPVYIGIAVAEGLRNAMDVAFVIHDGTYSMDFETTTIGGGSAQERAEYLADDIIAKITHYRDEHFYKFVGAGLTTKAVEVCPQLPTRLWLELDIVPLVLDPSSGKDNTGTPDEPMYNLVDEEADAVVRKALGYFGKANQPRLTVVHRNRVGVDSDGAAVIADESSYQKSVHSNTYAATMFYADSLKKNGTKIAFFNSTPQGGGVALMRHALIRFLRLIDIDCKWYVPKPKPAVFRITKNNHNILQGVEETGLRLEQKSIDMLEEWARQNADRYWIARGGPLAPRSEGGADVIIVDDPQMPSLVRIAKEQDPTRPVIFRSHIQVRASLADQQDTPTAGVWNWVWGNVKQCDVFISHPVREFVPENVTIEKVGYLPATTDWLDGLNKQLDSWDTQYYMHAFEMSCVDKGANKLAFPDRQYITQIARFDPAKGIPDVLASYAILRRKYMKDRPLAEVPQLVIAGHGAIDDPDATIIFDQTEKALNDKYADIKGDIVVMRVGPTDQILNILMSNARVALQLSTREGFEVKVSEALHHGVPIIATRRGGIPLQVEHGKSGFLVDVGEHDSVANYLNHLFTDEDAYVAMANYAANHVSDEVSTVGNALSWLYLADELANGKKKVQPNSRWINDMAREKAGFPYQAGKETTLKPRAKFSTPARGRWTDTIAPDRVGRIAP